MKLAGWGQEESITQSQWDEKILPVAQQVPVVMGEIGESDCAGAYIAGKW